MKELFELNWNNNKSKLQNFFLWHWIEKLMSCTSMSVEMFQKEKPLRMQLYFSLKSAYILSHKKRRYDMPNRILVIFHGLLVSRFVFS